MAPLLHKLGIFAFAHKWRVISGWILILLVAGVLAFQFMLPTSSSVSIPGTEAQKALTRFGELFPDAGKGSARIVIEAPASKTIKDYTPQVNDLMTKLQKVDGVSGVVSPFVNTKAISEDGTIAYIQVQLKQESGDVTDATISGVTDQVAAARQTGLTVEMGGDVVQKVPGEILGIGEVAGVVLALLVLVMTLGSLVAAGMPIATALVSIGVSTAGLFALSHVITISSTTPVLGVMLGLAVGIDYSLFIISKYRSYLLEGYDNKLAAGKAIGTAGNAVIFAAATVVIALSALTVVRIPFMSTMGLAGAATVACAALISISLIPALLGVAGDKVFRGKTRRAIKEAQAKGPHELHALSKRTIWYKWGAGITRHPIVILISAVIIVAAIALPARSLSLGLPTDEYAAKDTTQRKAYDLLSKGFGVGFNGQLLVVVENLPQVTEADKTAIREPLLAQFNQQVAQQTASQQAAFQKRAAAVKTAQQATQLQADIKTATAAGEAQKQAALAQIDATAQQYGKLHQLSLVAAQIAKEKGVAQATASLATDDGTKGVIQIVPQTAPADSQTIDLINRLRDPSEQAQFARTSGVTYAITGSTPLQTDINKKMSDALPIYLAVIVGLSFILLVIAFRSILIPIKATLGFLLSVLAMFGALVAVFQWGWFGIAASEGPIISFVPIIAIGILFGLAMDYEFFLVSSMHEAYHRTGDARRAVIDGFGLGSKVVTAAGVIMVSVFAGFISNHDVTIQSIGFGLALGVLIDAFIVRMTIVPAVMTLLGKSAWWVPKWLDKILPHVSIEGEELTESTKEPKL